MTRYQEYLQTSTWRNLKARAHHRDGSRCRICNSRSSLQVHHRQYPAILGTETLDDLTTLCGSCHKLFHHQEKRPSERSGISWWNFAALVLVAALLVIFADPVDKTLHCFPLLHCNVNKFILR